MPPKAASSKASRRRSTSAAPAKSGVPEGASTNGASGVGDNKAKRDVSAAAEEVGELSMTGKTPAKGRGKRPRVSDVNEEGGAEQDQDQDPSASAATPATGSRTLRPRAKTPVAETPARSTRRASSVVPSSAQRTKKPRVSAPPKPLTFKQGLNGLSVPFAVVENPVLSKLSFKPAYALPADLDPRKSDNRPLSAFIFGTGDNGQFGLGVEETDEIPRPRLHRWFAENSVPAAQTNGSTENENGEESMGQTDSKGAKLGPYGVEQVDCGGMHSLAIDSEGKVWSWGNNDNGSLGRITATAPEGMTSEDLETQPMLVEGLQAEGFRAVRVVAGDSLSLAIDDKGDMRAWGSFRLNLGEGAQILGLDGAPGAKNIAWTPVRLAAFKGQALYEMAAGDGHVLALTSDGHVLAYGNGESGQLGRKILQRRIISGFTPERVALKKIVHVAAGSYHSFALDDKGTVYGWGLNQYRQTGVPDVDASGEPVVHTPTVIDGLLPKNLGGAKVVKIACGEHHSVFLLDNGEVYGCGRCDDHQVGLSPSHEAMAELRELQKEAKGKQDEWAQENAKKLEKEGMSPAEAREQSIYNAAAALPIPNDFIDTPTKLSFPDSEDGQPTKIVGISAKSHHAVAISNAGEAFGWGRNITAQLGLGDETIIEEPTRIRSKALKPYKVIAAATGFQHSMLLAGQTNEAASAAAPPA